VQKRVYVPNKYGRHAMHMQSDNRIRQNRHHGFVQIYLLLIFTALMGFCSLAVDLGRVQMVKTELRRAADAAARAGATVLPQGNSTVIAEAVRVAGLNLADGQSVYINSATDVKIGTWDTTNHTFTNGTLNPNAVQVTANRTNATRNAVHLYFASILGIASVDERAVSIAAILPVQAPVTQFVSAHSNPWLAGATNGTLASEPDPGYPRTSHKWKWDIAGSYMGQDSSKVVSTDAASNEPFGTPSLYSIKVTPGAVLQINVPLNSSNTAVNDYTHAQTYEADGSNGGTFNDYSDDAATNSTAPGYTGTGNANSPSDATGSEHGISNLNTPINSMVGVFLDDKVPDTEDAKIPPGKDYSTQTARDYTTVSPELRQTFYVGNGETSTSVQQTIVVPPNATRLFLGTMDGHEWSNNVGGYNATIVEYQISLVK
jgi:hypothetical protein